MEFGGKLRYYRCLRQLSLRDLARKAKCTASQILQIERGTVSPTIKTAERICNALGVSLADLLKIDPSNRPKVILSFDHQEYSVLMKWPELAMYDVKVADAEFPLSVVLLRLPPNARTPPRHSLYSEVQLFVVLQGTVTLELDERNHSLSGGDFVIFDVNNPHSWFNASADEVQIVIATPLRFRLFETVENDIRWQKLFKEQRRQEKRDSPITNSREKPVLIALSNTEQ
jgi:transcriptional regulator with XRE-family HTH domain